MKILFVIAPDDSEREAATQLVADLVEALTYRAAPQEWQFLVLADLRDCLEIGLATLGRSASRTVEGGERVRSPLLLLPVGGEDFDNGAENALRHPSNDIPPDSMDNGGTLEDLVQLGAVERHERWTIGSQVMRVDQALELMVDERFDRVLFMAGNENQENLASRLVRPGGDGESDYRVRALDDRSRLDRNRVSPTLWSPLNEDDENAALRETIASEVANAVRLSFLLDTFARGELRA